MLKGGGSSLNLKQMLHGKSVRHMTFSRVSHPRSPDPPISGDAASVASDPFVTCEIYRWLTTACHDLMKHSYSHIRAREKLRMRARVRERESMQQTHTHHHLQPLAHRHSYPEEAWCSCCRVTLMPVKLNGRSAKGFLRSAYHFLSACGYANQRPEVLWRYVCVCVWICSCACWCVARVWGLTYKDDPHQKYGVETEMGQEVYFRSCIQF